MVMMRVIILVARTTLMPDDHERVAKKRWPHNKLEHDDDDYGDDYGEDDNFQDKDDHERGVKKRDGLIINLIMMMMIMMLTVMPMMMMLIKIIVRATLIITKEWQKRAAS